MAVDVQITVLALIEEIDDFVQLAFCADVEVPRIGLPSLLEHAGENFALVLVRLFVVKGEGFDDEDFGLRRGAAHGWPSVTL
jgi:hypothetical protein